MQVFDCCAEDITERSAILLVETVFRRAFVEGKRVAVTVEGTVERMATGSRHFGNGNVGSQFQKLVQVVIISVDV